MRIKTAFPVLLSLMLFQFASGEEVIAKKIINGEVLIKNISWREALTRLAAQTNTMICYEEIIERGMEASPSDVSLKLKNASLSMVLNEILKLSAGAFSWEENEGVIIVMPKGNKMMNKYLLNARIPVFSVQQKTLKEMITEELPKAAGKEWNAELLKDSKIPETSKFDLDLKHYTLRKIFCKLAEQTGVPWRYCFADAATKGTLEFFEPRKTGGNSAETKTIDLTNPDQLAIALLKTNAIDVIVPMVLAAPDIRQTRIFEEKKEYFMEIILGPEHTEKVLEFTSKNIGKDAYVKFNFRNMGSVSIKEKTGKLIIRGSSRQILEKIDKKMIKTLGKK